MRAKGYSVQAVPVASGIAIGRVMLLPGAVPAATDIVIPAGQVNEELARFRAALEETKKQLRELRERLREKLHDSEAGIFDAHLMLAEDKTLISEIERNITEEHFEAESAVNRAVNKIVEAFAEVEDAYLRERAVDIRDIGNRIAGNISEAEQQLIAYDEPRIVIASTLTPSETVGMNREHVLGFAVETGSATSHTALLARSLHIPAVVGVPKDLLDSLTVADKLIVDGFSGKVIVNPDAGTEEAYRLKSREAERIFLRLRDESILRPVTTDGFSVEIVANLDAHEDYREIRRNGAWEELAPEEIREWIDAACAAEARPEDAVRKILKTLGAI